MMSSAKAQVTLQEALTHHRAGRFERAATLYAQIRRTQPQHFNALHLGGLAVLQLGRSTEAVELLSKATRLSPQSGLTWMGLGIAQAHLGLKAQAETSLRHAVKVDPKNIEAWSNLGSVLIVANRLEEAATAYRRALELNPKFAQAWTALGSVQQLQSRSREAIENHSRALALEPTHPKARLARAQAYQSLHDTENALADFEAQLARSPTDHEAQSYRLFLLNYSASLPRETLAAEHRRYGRGFPPPSLAPFFPQSFAPDRPLRVAFCSPDLRSHSVAYFLEPLLRHLDPGQFEIILYHDHFIEDATSARLRNCASVWRNFVGQSTDVVEKQIRDDRPDVLIDLAGHSGMNRLPVFARRVAPVQASYLGYPNTSGLTTMDYRLTDGVADPAGLNEEDYSEKLLRFSSTAWAYSPSPHAPAPKRPPSAAGAPVTFGSFNNLSKVNDLTLCLWREVLWATPGSRLLLKSFELNAEQLLPRLAAALIPNERVTLAEATPSVADHLACYHQVDIALDPFPYQGTTTTCEALWMGVPVVTLRGDRHAARVGASLLTAIKHPEWIANDSAKYVDIASKLAADGERLAQIRANLRHEMQSSVLLDHPAQAASFGLALRACWQRACAERASPSPAGTAVVSR